MVHQLQQLHRRNVREGQPVSEVLAGRLIGSINQTAQRQQWIQCMRSHLNYYPIPYARYQQFDVCMLNRLTKLVNTNNYSVLRSLKCRSHAAYWNAGTQYTRTTTTQFSEISSAKVMLHFETGVAVRRRNEKRKTTFQSSITHMKVHKCLNYIASRPASAKGQNTT
jgi:hypothetical protein